MTSLKSILFEESTPLRFYHGGTRWSRIPDAIGPAKKNRYEGGVGIYFTNSYATARKYGRGGKVVHLVEIDRSYKDINTIRVNVDEMVEDIKNVSMLRHKSEIIADIKNYSIRTNRLDIPLEIFNNLIVNYESGAGKAGQEIVKYFLSKGADANLQPQQGDEYWLVVFNPKIIKRFSIVDPSKLKMDDYILSV
jgi:hypothetical protein